MDDDRPTPDDFAAASAPAAPPVSRAAQPHPLDSLVPHDLWARAVRPPAPEWVDLRVLTWNCHAGVAIANGGLQYIDEQLEPDLWLLQEVRRIRPVRRVLTHERFWLAPGRDHSGTVILADKGRFEREGAFGDPLISAGLSPMHPERRRTTARLYDGDTDRLVVAHSVHTWAMGRGLARAKPVIRRGHVKQTEAFADSCARRHAEHVVLAGGDWNENMASARSNRHRDSAVSIMGRAGMTPARVRSDRRPTSVHGSSVLDDLFVRNDPFVHIRERRVVDVPVRGNDHRAVLVVLRVKRRQVPR